MRAYAAMLPRLQAEERLAAIDTLVIGGGRMEQRTAGRAIRRLQAVAEGGRRARAVKATPEMLAAMGIGFSTAPQKGVNDD